MIVYVMLILSVITFTLIIDIFINNDKKSVIKEKMTDDVGILFEDKK